MPPTPTRAEMYDRYRQRYERQVAAVAHQLRRMADDVERAGARLGHAALGDMPHSQAAGYVIQAATSIHNLHLGELAQTAADADRYHPDLAPDEAPTAPAPDLDTVGRQYVERIETERRDRAEG